MPDAVARRSATFSGGDRTSSEGLWVEAREGHAQKRDRPGSEQSPGALSVGSDMFEQGLS